MRLYPRNGATSTTIDGVGYEPGADGGFDFPEPHASDLAKFPHWETQVERAIRLAAEAKAKRSDPEYQAGLLERIAAAAEGDPRDAEIAALKQRLAQLEGSPAPRRRGGRKPSRSASPSEEAEAAAGEDDEDEGGNS